MIPGQVNQDLWNEHVARYLFAARLSRGRRVLDLACGTGYGASELARGARQVVGLDVAAEAVSYATAHYRAANVEYVQGSCTQAPLADASFDLVTAFEVIEHLAEWRALLEEARRLLAPGGQLVVSTPNKRYYAESRGLTGENPYHKHEFEFEEFREALSEVFPHVSLFVQNHTYGVAFQPLGNSSAVETRLESGSVEPGESHFFVAVCALSAQTGAPTFVYLPTAANVLRERERHIARLDGELKQKNEWLREAQQEHQALLEQHRRQTGELEAKNRWAEGLNRQLEEAHARIQQVQEELAAEQAAAMENASAYEAKIGELERESAEKALWAQETEQRLSAELAAKCEELAQCVRLLDAAEKTVEERTRWAQELEGKRAELERALSMVQASRWHRMGRRLGLGPEVGGS